MHSRMNNNHYFEEAAGNIAVDAPLASVCCHGRVRVAVHICFVSVVW